ncbi:MAG: zinc-binding dehydrogenase [Planctomycetes bacterium]|nr:zinc-binding dehydrogenase [Planctomycetota bacterium]
MMAVTISGHGGPEVVRIQDAPEPRPAAGEVLLDVRAAALNHLDIWVRKGRPGMGLRFPHVVGSDAAGVVAEAGPAVQGVRPGDEVILNPGISCGCCEFCRRGRHSECPSFTIVGLGRPGTFAERVAVPAECAYPKPGHLDFRSAAALPLAHLTAWRMLVARAALRPGETVLIHGIGGGVALAGLQIAKLLGAEVIVTSSSREKLNRARSLGADQTIDYAAEPDVARKVLDVTGGRGADVVLDTVGAATWKTDFAAVRRGGRIVLCGVTTGAAAETPLNVLYWNQVSVLGSTMGSHEDFRLMLRAVAAAKLEPVVDSVLPLERAAEAFARMEAGQQFGKIVLTP